MASKKKSADPNARTCAHCLAVQGRAGVTRILPCKRCGLVAYCSKDCQRAHWGAHKKDCLAPAQRTVDAALLQQGGAASSSGRRWTGGDDDNCAVCLYPLSDARITTLPCDHQFHEECVDQLQQEGHKCPLCRAELPHRAAAAKDAQPLNQTQRERPLHPRTDVRQRRGRRWNNRGQQNHGNEEAAAPPQMNLRAWASSKCWAGLIVALIVGGLLSYFAWASQNEAQQDLGKVQMYQQGDATAQFNLGYRFHIAQSYAKAVRCSSGPQGGGLNGGINRDTLIGEFFNRDVFWA